MCRATSLVPALTGLVVIRFGPTSENGRRRIPNGRYHRENLDPVKVIPARTAWPGTWLGITSTGWGWSGIERSPPPGGGRDGGTFDERQATDHAGHHARRPADRGRPSGPEGRGLRGGG